MAPVDATDGSLKARPVVQSETVSVPHYPQPGKAESLTATLQVSILFLSALRLISKIGSLFFLRVTYNVSNKPACHPSEGC